MNGVGVSSARRLVRAGDGVPWKAVDSITADGYLEGAGQAALTDAQNEMMRELVKGGNRDLVFERDDGQASATLLDASRSLGGVWITDGPHFEDVKGPEYVSQRHFTFTGEAEFLLRSAPALLDWAETVRITGGGPVFACMPALVGPPQRQMIWQIEPCTAVQQGMAVGTAGYPNPAPPIWPFALAKNGLFERTSARKIGFGGYTEFRITWSYEFNWPLPLFGFPTPWPL